MEKSYVYFALKPISCSQHAMEAMVAVAVLVNCALIGLSGPVHRLLPDATPAQTILVIVALEVRKGDRDDL